ncbi:MAG: 4Fe-4S binding protein [Paracoccaceae bacterium]
MSEPTLLLCDCTGSMRVDAEAIAQGCGLTCQKVGTYLCRDEAARAAQALQTGDVIIACGQEAESFRDLAEDLGATDRLTCIDIRDRAGWSDDRDASPKMAALIAEARLPAPEVPAMDVVSGGVCLVIGKPDVALPAAARLSTTLAVTCMIPEAGDLHPPTGAQIDVVAGRVSNAAGALGQFSVTVDGFCEWSPAGRGARTFTSPVNGAKSDCDVIVDLTGDAPMFPAHQKRDGYLRADPADPLAVERVLFEASHLVGTFEKPLYIRFDANLCAHSRAEQTGCTRCLDLCPTSAILPAGESVSIDPNVCAGCGACAAVCPSGAASADDPPVQHTFTRLRTLAETYRKAGGAAPRLLVHDDHGAEMISLAARFGRGVPADVIPFELASLGAFGHAEMLAALAVGFAHVHILPGPRTERQPIDAQIGIARAIAAAGAPNRIGWVDVDDPDALSQQLYSTEAPPMDHGTILPLGGRREVTRLAATAILGGAPEVPLPLPAGAPYGTIKIDTQKCTLCLACVSLCPPGALGDNPDKPEVNFREEACLQCGICATVCPETAIELVPQLDLRPSALATRELHGEEPFCCVECGKPFGVKSTIEKIVTKLEGVHSMFTNSDNARLIQMCDDCRVNAQFKASDNPFQMGDRPKIRTTQDYLDDRED